MQTFVLLDLTDFKWVFEAVCIYCENFVIRDTKLSWNPPTPPPTPFPLTMYFCPAPQVDGMVQEFAGINRGMEKTGTFTMDRKKLFQLVGKANSNLADVILRVGLFDR